jgi:hypothetical protein
MDASLDSPVDQPYLVAIISHHLISKEEDALPYKFTNVCTQITALKFG